MTRRAIVAAVMSLSTLAGIEAHAAFPQSPEMMAHYLQHQAEQRFEHWRQRYEQLKTPEQIAAYQKDLREHFLQAIGGLPISGSEDYIDKDVKPVSIQLISSCRNPRINWYLRKAHTHSI